MERQIYLAYDGSINADWVARYAIRMAAALDRRQITLLHILDHPAAKARMEERFAAIAAECATAGIDCRGQIRRPDRDVCSGLLQAIPAGETSYCLCGARIASRGRGFLAGTVSERLLRAARFNVMAIRVVSPGLLGCPRTLLFPLAGHPRGFSSAMPFLQMLTTPQSTVHLLRVMMVNPLLSRYVSAEIARARLAAGREYLVQAVSHIRREMADAPCHLDHHVVVSDDWAREILLQADRVHASMILLGATERSLPSRFFYGNRLEEILRRTPCDVGIYRRP
ncbi:MAG: universal stress protein [Desulfobulbaceae bacterium]|nr:MAG: universal stress protein [Desulfobulbaceae bacterium]